MITLNIPSTFAKISLLLLLPLGAHAVILNEVSPTLNRVEIYNDSAIATNLTDYYFCTQHRYPRVGNSNNVTVESGSLNLQPGAFVVLTITNSTYDLLDSGADLGLYRNNTNFSDPANMEDYIQWGSSSNPPGRQTEAASAGIWTVDTYTAVPGTGESLIRGDTGSGVDAWSVTSSPTFGAPNDSTSSGSDGGISVEGWTHLNNYPYVWSDNEQGWTYFKPTEEGLWIYSFTFESWTLRAQGGSILYTDVEPQDGSGSDTSGGDTSGGGDGGGTVEEPY